MAKLNIHTSYDLCGAASQEESARRSGVVNAIAIADRVADAWSENDLLPDVGAAEYLIGLRHASDQDSDAQIVRSILEQRVGD